jgi:hypothetical protein
MGGRTFSQNGADTRVEEAGGVTGVERQVEEDEASMKGYFAVLSTVRTRYRA